MATNNPLGLSPFDAAEYLTDEESIAEFLNASFEIGDPDVLLGALAAVARARGIAQLAEQTGLGRESLYKALKPGAHPRYDTVLKVVHALGVDMRFHAPKPTASSRAKNVAAKRRRPASGDLGARSTRA
jgi:probable addiction module antidote protein